jgi:hypothetical protein
VQARTKSVAADGTGAGGRAMSPAEPKKDGAYDPLASPGGFSLVEFATRRRVTVA